MTTSFSDPHVLDLSQKGASLILSVANFPEITVRAIDHETWGNAVVTVQKIYGGDHVAFLPAVTISAAYPTAEQLNVGGVMQIRLVVTTADTVGFGRIGVYGKETPAAIYPFGQAQSISIGFSEAVALGFVPRWSSGLQFGYNADITTASDPEDVWNGGGLYTGQPLTGSAETLQVFSSDAADAAAGTGARTLELFGLDGDYNEITETITMNGTTPVVTSQSFWRVTRARVLTAGSGTVNVGTITARHSTTTANVFFVMAAGLNVTRLAAYTVPANTTMLVTEVFSQLAQSSGSGKFADCSFRTREPTQTAYQPKFAFVVSSDAGFDINVTEPVVVPEKTDVLIRVDEVSGTVGVDAGWAYKLYRSS